uniref:Protein transport protein Sec61 subunit gamma n=1 Tax=Salix viminalis TaxID=40686 RepID=A0A6N2NH48_SALVM
MYDVIWMCDYRRYSVVDPLREFAKDSVRLVKRCHKPDQKEFTKVASRTAIGFVVMGFVGFFVKLIFIPINNIIFLESTSKFLRHHPTF